MKRFMALGAAVLALGAGAAAFGQKATAGGAAAAQADGGLAVSSGTIDAPAKAGAYGPVKVSNRSATALTVTVAPRQWTQAASGKVSPNRRGSLGGVSVSAPSFTLAPGEERDLTVNVASIPAAGIAATLTVRSRSSPGASVKLGALTLTPASPPRRFGETLPVAAWVHWRGATVTVSAAPDRFETFTGPYAPALAGASIVPDDTARPPSA